MPLTDAIRFLNIQKSSTKDIIDVIKNDEFFSSCCKIIEEKNLNGQDILNLTEHQILTWNPPPWLIRNLLSLKSTLSRNSENKKHNFQSQLGIENEKETKYLSLGSTQDESEDFYDDNNYLRPTALNVSVKKKIGKPLPEIPPSTDSNSTKLRRDRKKSLSPFRNPIPFPREDEDTEENVYEPAPITSAKVKNKSSTSYSTPMPIEEDNVYETPPLLPHKFQQNASKFYISTPVLDKSARNYTNVEIKRDFAPPLPLRTITTLQNATRNNNVDRNNPPYTNVVNQIIKKNFVHRNPSFPDENEVIVKKSPRLFLTTPDSNIKLLEVSKSEKSGIFERPLPPLPRRNSMNELKIQENLSPEEIEGLKNSLRKTSFPTEILEKSGRTAESSKPLQSDILQELRTSNIPPFRKSLRNNSLNSENPLSMEQNNNHETVMKSIISNSNSENKSSTNFLAEIKKIKLRSTKLQTGKTANDNDNPTKPFKSTKSHISCKINSMTIGTKLRTTKSSANKYLVGPSADEGESVIQERVQKPNIFSTAVNQIKPKTIVKNEESLSNDENEDTLADYINIPESKKVFTSNSNAQGFLRKKSTDVVENEGKVSAEFVSHTENTNRNIESKTPVQTSVYKNSHQSRLSDLINKISAVKLKPTTIAQKKITNENANEIEDLPEYTNEEELRKPNASSVTPTKLNKTIQNSNSSWAPNVQLYDTKIENNEYSSQENDDEDFPEYGNLPEILKFTKQPLNVEATSSSSESDAAEVSPFSQIISEVTKKKLKPTNYLKSLDDRAAEILKQKLLERKKGSTGNQKEAMMSKPSVKLAVPPAMLPTSFLGEYLQAETDISQANSEEELQHDYDQFDGVYNLNNERYYRNTDRKGAALLLKGLEDGAFVLRPSTEKKFYLSITVKTRNKCYNLGIMKNEKEQIFSGDGNMRSPNFSSIKAFLEYFEKYPLMLQGGNGVEHVYLKKVLPDNRF